MRRTLRSRGATAAAVVAAHGPKRRSARERPLARTRRTIACVLAAGLFFAASAAHSANSLLSGYCVHAMDMSADGKVVVGANVCGAPAEPIRWSAAQGVAGLGLPPGAVSGAAEATSADGSIVVGTAYYGVLADRSEAFRWTSGTGFVGLGVLPGADSSSAHGISDDGSVVVGVSGNDAFRWTATGGMVSLGPGGATATSPDGAVVVGWTGNEPMRWTAETGMVGLGHLAFGFNGLATDVSADGSVVVGSDHSYFPSHEEAFRWTADGGMVGLGHLPLGDPPGEEYSAAAGISADGSIVVGASYKSNHPQDNRAFIWDAVHGMRDLHRVLEQDYGLDLGRWHFLDATDISNDGRSIVGNGSAFQSTRSWLVGLDCYDDGVDVDGDGTADTCDNCPFVVNADQSDAAGIGSGSRPDGIGDACQCGDVNGDGAVTIADGVAIQRSLLSPPTAVLDNPELCDTSGDGLCTIADSVVTVRALLVPATATISQACALQAP